MSFTDEDLKRLKLRLSADYFVRNKFVDAQDMEALLARLEEAEKVILSMQGASNYLFTYCEKLEAWRKACGK